MIWDPHAYLLVDNEIVESESNTSMVRAEAYKHPANPLASERTRALFGGDPRCDVIAPLCICRDGGRYRMWYLYHSSDASGYESPTLPAGTLAYAESTDGLSFSPARAGKRGSLVRITGRRDLGVSALLHDPADPRFPYKAVILRKGDARSVNPALRAKYPLANGSKLDHPCAGWFVWGLARSPDGFAWELPTHKDNLVDAFIEGPSLFRALDNGLVISNQMVTKVSDIGWRKVKGWVTYDGRTGHRIPDYLFALPDHMTLVQPPFQQNMNWAHTPWAQSHVALVPARKGPTMLALHGFLYGAIGCETYAQTAEIGLASSSTGYSFQQVWPFRPFLRRGNMGEWDCGLVVQSALVDAGVESRLYYTATAVGNAAGAPYRLGCGIIGRDRYGYRALRVYRDYAAPKDRRGHVVLKPLTLPKRPKLAINVTHVTPTRTIRAALLEADGRPLPGFTAARCTPLTQEGIARPLVWKEADLARLAGKTVKLRIELHSPDCQYGDTQSPRVYAAYTDGGPA